MSLMSYVNQTVTDILGPFGWLMIVGVLGFMLVLIALPVLMQKEEDPLDKLNKQNRAKAKAAEAAGQETRLRTANGKDKLEKYSNFLEPQNAEEYSAVKLKLLQAGYKSKNAVRMYHFSQFALGIGLLLAGLAYTLFKINTAPDGEEMTTQSMIMSAALPGVVGYMMPKYWVTRRQAERQEQIINGFPDSLDMMLVCVEAGQSLDQSIIRVSREIRAGFPALAEEFEIVSYEMKAGKDRIQVLRDMSERAGVADVQSFVTVLIQSQQFGTSIAEALRVYSSEMRDKRVMRAEEKANTLPTKMTLATMMLTVPPLLIILIGPSVYGIAETLSNANF
jgi:tight adherence protein C